MTADLLRCSRPFKSRAPSQGELMLFSPMPNEALAFTGGSRRI